MSQEDPNTQSRLRNLENQLAAALQGIQNLANAVAQLQAQVGLVRQAPVTGSPASGGVEYFAWVPTSSNIPAATGTAPLLTPGAASMEIYQSINGGALTDTGSAQTVYNIAGIITGPILVEINANNWTVVQPC